MKKIVKATIGYCYCCKKKTVFISYDYWLRDYYHCLWCKSIPRQRAVMKVLQEQCMNYQDLMIHESSPFGATFKNMKANCKNYSYSYFYENRETGSLLPGGGINQNLENMTFNSDVFDVFITQDVMEHVNDPRRAYIEIARVLKPNGIHIFTTPIYCFQKTRSRIVIKDGKRSNILPPVFHGNPIDQSGSLVTYDWGYDICEFIEESCGMKSEIIDFRDSKENCKCGLEADFLQVIVSKKHKIDVG